MRGFPGGELHGAAVDAQSRCVHHAGPTDVVALRLPCCGRWYGCAACHDADADHARRTWPAATGEPVACCGACGHLMDAARYLAAEACPECAHPFNPGCRAHHDRYFGFVPGQTR
ncbi:CHY zinc finger protein [Microbacterium gorillae]|uniref:CHY zinc finger protein n=1 Tax=Microbacterium gorillae TaxID=1231063 RepID=UPI000AE31F01|nr:CHY zinc finger protein [Microbacterium gorillae]